MQEKMSHRILFKSNVKISDFSILIRFTQKKNESSKGKKTSNKTSRQAENSEFYVRRVNCDRVCCVVHGVVTREDVCVWYNLFIFLIAF